MTEGIIIALIGFLGTIIGSAIGVIASSKLINYRLEQLPSTSDYRFVELEHAYELHEANRYVINR